MLKHSILAIAITVFTGCVHVEARRSQHLFSASEDCKLSSVVVATDNSSVRRCVTFNPNLTRASCGTWTHPGDAHRRVVDRLASPGNDLSQRIDEAGKDVTNPAHKITEGDLALFKGSASVNLRVPKQADVTTKLDAIDLVAIMRRAYIEVNNEQLQCLNAQTERDIKSQVKVEANERIEGFVVKANLGYAHTLYLSSAELDGTGAGDSVKVSASALNLSSTIRGAVAAEYIDNLRELLSKDLDGASAAIAGTKLTSMAPNVTAAQTVEVSVQAFPMPPEPQK